MKNKFIKEKMINEGYSSSSLNSYNSLFYHIEKDKNLNLELEIKKTKLNIIQKNILNQVDVFQTKRFSSLLEAIKSSNVLGATGNDILAVASYCVQADTIKKKAQIGNSSVVTDWEVFKDYNQEFFLLTWEEIYKKIPDCKPFSFYQRQFYPLT